MIDCAPNKRSSITFKHQLPCFELLTGLDPVDLLPINADVV